MLAGSEDTLRDARGEEPSFKRPKLCIENISEADEEDVQILEAEEVQILEGQIVEQAAPAEQTPPAKRQRPEKQMADHGTHVPYCVEANHKAL